MWHCKTSPRHLAALAAKADVIATGDRDLLVLHPWQGIRILNAADALQLVQNSVEI